jgi:hypothetical protein
MPCDEEVTQRAGSLRSMTGLSEAEFTALLPTFERALVTSMQDRTIDGQPRTSRRYRTYKTCPLPTTADELTMMLTTPSPEPPTLVPLVFMMGPNAQSSVQRTLRSSKSITVGRRNATRSKTSL